MSPWLSRLDSQFADRWSALVLQNSSQNLTWVSWALWPCCQLSRGCTMSCCRGWGCLLATCPWKHWVSQGCPWRSSCLAKSWACPASGVLWCTCLWCCMWGYCLGMYFMNSGKRFNKFCLRSDFCQSSPWSSWVILAKVPSLCAALLKYMGMDVLSCSALGIWKPKGLWCSVAFTLVSSDSDQLFTHPFLSPLLDQHSVQHCWHASF